MNRPRFDPYTPVNIQVKERVIELERLAYSQSQPDRFGRDNPIHYRMLAALVKKEVGESFKPVQKETFYVSFSSPKTWLDHLKTHLPHDLKFGWLTPKFETTTKRVEATCQINILKYELIVTPSEQNRFVRLIERSEDIDLSADPFFRETKSDRTQ